MRTSTELWVNLYIISPGQPNAGAYAAGEPLPTMDAAIIEAATMSEYCGPGLRSFRRYSHTVHSKLVAFRWVSVTTDLENDVDTWEADKLTEAGR